MKNIFKIALMMMLVIGMNGCSKDDSSSSGGSNGDSGGGSESDGVSKSGTFTVTMDGKDSVLYTYTYPQLGDPSVNLNTAFYTEISAGSNINYSGTAYEAFTDLAGTNTFFRVSFADAASVTSGDYSSNGITDILGFTLNDVEYTTIDNGAYEVYTVVLTTADYDGTTLHMIGTIDASLYKKNTFEEKVVHIAFDVKATKLQ